MAGHSNGNGRVADPNFVILYVKDAAASADFYASLLGRAPAQAAPTFAAFPLASGVTLGLWTRGDVAPPVTGTGDRAEICFPVADAGAVRAMHEDWRARGLKIAQTPTAMDFGATFVALDPDGHRLRVFAPARA
ncbi:MAG TPA: VOC family protein [Xanthobacteraceae bacterium]|nr:VOC family protein [Xanthobacteraceae bacterium]